MSDTSLEVLGADSPASTSQDASSSTSGTSVAYDDSKVIERLDGIIKRFDTVDDALKSLEQRQSTKSDGTATTVTLDATQYEAISSRAGLNTYFVLVTALIGFCIFGAMLWHFFSSRWEL